MKLIIHTQVRENYGSEDEPYWKFKGGNTYAVADLSSAHVKRIEEKGIPTLTSLIESFHPMYEEYILETSIVNDSETEDWEDLTTYLKWTGNTWKGYTSTSNTGYMRGDVDKMISSFTLGPGGALDDTSTFYIMKDGTVLAQYG